MDHSKLLLAKLFPEGANNPEITSKEFEEIIHLYLSSLGNELKSFSAIHNASVEAFDGEYQIDVLAKFEFLGASFTVLVECKRHKNPIKREVVQALHGKINSLGAHKGLVFSTSEFQSGAIEYAEEHGIALITVKNARLTYRTKSADSVEMDIEKINALNRMLDEFGEPKYQCVYMRGNSLSVLSPGSLESLDEFLFKEK